MSVDPTASLDEAMRLRSGALDRVVVCLLELPEQIAAKARELAKTSMTLEEDRANVVRLKSQIMLEVTAATMIDGKPKYSNDTARIAARDVILEALPEYKQKTDAIKAGEKQVSETRIDLELLQNKFSALRAIVMMNGGK